MKTRYIVLIILAFSLSVALSAINIYLSSRRQIDVAKAIYDVRQQQDVEYERLVANAVAKIVIPQPKDGKDGVNGITTTVEKNTIETLPGQKGDKGDTGNPGKDGEPGKDAPKVILSTDPDTGDIIYRYSNTTIWQILVEKCSLNNTCEEQ